jgi:hypothetical protein
MDCGRGDLGEGEPHTMPMLRSTVAMRLFAFGLSSLLVTSFSRARTTPSLQRIPMAVPPFSTALTAYSTYSPIQYSRSVKRKVRRCRTWKFRPSGEKTEFVRS